ncbi:branched-chain amino acid ABC transporter permease [Halostella salina]|uniref:branched-chain amino acid ABC transporter permease n=1 Tax=Halostella salina TaxID=1547897 RepID=UPI000EF78E2C|nr:branched-chain amino acid ABC transporter permease [Halostella salina]
MSGIAVVDVLVDLLDPSTLAGIFLGAFSKSALYVMIASGLSLIFGLMGVLNFAHGSLTMLGAYLGGAVMVVLVSGGTGGPTRLLLFFVAIAATFALLTLLGGAIEVTLIRPLYDRAPLFQILLTFGVVLVLDELVRIAVELYGLQPRTDWQAAFGTAPDFLAEWYTVAGVTTRGLYLFEGLLGVLAVVAIWAFLTRTRYGLYIRAGSEDPEMTRALGVDVRRAFTVVFGVGAGLAGVAGVVLMWDPRFGASVPLGVETLLVAFVVVIIGGLGSFRGTVAAAGIVGLTDAFATWLFVNDHVAFAGLPEMVSFVVLVGVLIVRPQGLFGVAEVGGH